MTSTKAPWSSVRWVDVLEDASVEYVEHPVYSALRSKHDMAVEMGAVMRHLDGTTMSDFVDFFWCRDPTDTSVLRIRGSDERHDLTDWAIDEGCLPPLGRPRANSDDTSSSDASEYTLHSPLGASASALPRIRTASAPDHAPTPEWVLLRDATRTRSNSEPYERAPKVSALYRKKVASGVKRINKQRRALARLHKRLAATVNEGVRLHLIHKIHQAQRLLHKLMIG